MGNIKPLSITRRQFLAGSVTLAASGGLAKWRWLKSEPVIAGDIVGASSAIGHKLRDGNFPVVTETFTKKAVIIGGGIAGLSAAWKLHQSGVDDFVLLELEKEVGGNASSGENAISAYPWGAHYVPLLTEESKAARELFQELGIITGYEKGQPVYNEYYISSDPHERLFMYGRWQEGLVPQIGISPADHSQYKAFFAAMEWFKMLKGRDGLRVFSIPVDTSSKDGEWQKLDSITMAEYMDRNGWDSKPLRWYVDYCCRDDYGATMDQVSAWAGIHYFAARNGKAANADTQSVITWPEGNGWIVKQLKAKLSSYVKPNALAFKVEKTEHAVNVQYWDVGRNMSTVINADAVIFATPRFIAERLMPSGINISAFHIAHGWWQT